MARRYKFWIWLTKRGFSLLEWTFGRRSVGKSRIEKSKNSRISENMEIKQDILQTIELNKLKWYRHVCKISFDRLPKVITDWKPNG